MKKKFARLPRANTRKSTLTFDKPQALNNFNLLRFLAASLVIYTHCYGLTGKLPNPQQDYFAHCIYLLGNVGVDIFFIISGFLITKSYLSRNNFWVFIRARALRLYPGLLCAVVFSGLLIGPLTTTTPLKDYFYSTQLQHYFFYNLSLLKSIVILPGVFSNNVYANTVNGSLWTLPAEARMYLLIACFGVTGVLFKRTAYTLVLLGAVILYAWNKAYIPLISDNPLYYKLSGFFFSGSFYYIYRDRIPLNAYVSAGLLCLLVLGCLYFTEYRLVIYGLGLPYLTLWFAFNITVLHGFNKLGDYSYGIYIYAFPLQQLIISHHPDITIIPLFYSSLLLTLVLAIPSWHFLEKPALSYK